jgi:PAB-dependent poly(A)-specific ribonuclease subunit 2
MDRLNVRTRASEVKGVSLLTCICYRPLNSVGLPYYTSPLLSSWSPLFVPSNGVPKFPPLQKIPPSVLASMKRSGNVAYAPLPKELRGRRNVVTAPKRATARFRSGRIQRHEVSRCL